MIDLVPSILASALGFGDGLAIAKDEKDNAATTANPATKRWQSLYRLGLILAGAVGGYVGLSPKVATTVVICGVTGFSDELGEKLQGDTTALV